MTHHTHPVLMKLSFASKNMIIINYTSFSTSLSNSSLTHIISTYHFNNHFYGCRDKPLTFLSQGVCQKAFLTFLW